MEESSQSAGNKPSVNTALSTGHSGASGDSSSNSRHDQGDRYHHYSERNRGRNRNRGRDRNGRQNNYKGPLDNNDAPSTSGQQRLSPWRAP